MVVKTEPGIGVSTSRLTKETAAKERRVGLLRVQGSASNCPHTFSRVLDRLLVMGGVPVSISFARRQRSARFSILLDGMAMYEPDLVVARLRAIPLVQSIRASYATKYENKRRAEGPLSFK